MSVAADTSVVLAALLADHEAHEAASEALDACTHTIGHVVLEAFSVLTRLPAPHRIQAAAAVAVLQARLPKSTVALEAEAFGWTPGRLAEAGVSGGAVYDGLIALTARQHDLELLSRDGRAARTYRALEIRFRLLR